jgi:RHS repeat-associated protein
VTGRTDPLSRSESYSYDGDGNLTQFTDRRGKVTTYTYDNLNRKTFAGFGTGTGPTYESTIGYTYDASNRLTQAVDSVAGTISRTFDGLDRMTEETTPQGSVSYGYDAAGRRTSMTVGSLTAVSYAYDNANRLTEVSRGTPTVSFSYDSANRRTSLTLPNGVTMSYSYDSASEVTGISYATSSTTLGSLTYSYDLAGRRVTMGGSFAAVNLPSAISTTGYDAANELTAWGTATPTYDSNGNTTSDGTNSYVWNARNQLASMNSTGDSFQYDPFGRRAAKTIVSTTTNYLYDGWNPVQELSGGTVTANLLTGLALDERFTRTDSSATANFLTDGLGSTLALTDGSVSTLASYAYEPFGNTTSTGSSTNSYQYTGRESDGTGVYFYRARYYSPLLGRFVSEDPLGVLGSGSNLYAYAGDTPANWRDPLGTMSPDGAVPSGPSPLAGRKPPANPCPDGDVPETIDPLSGVVAQAGGDVGPVSPSVSYVPSTGNIYPGLGIGGGGVGAYIAAGVTTNPDLTGSSAGGCAFDVVGGCASVSAAGDVTVLGGFGTPSAAPSVGHTWKGGSVPPVTGTVCLPAPSPDAVPIGDGLTYNPFPFRSF